MFFKKPELLVLPPTENIEEITKDISVKVTKAYYSALEFCFKDNVASITHKGKDLKTFSFVWLSSSWHNRDLATTVKLYLEKYNVKHTFVEQSTSKITDSMNFVLSEIAYPNTYYVETCKTLNHLNAIEDTCGYPLIIKDSKGFGGNGLTYVCSREELIKFVSNRTGEKRYIFQKYIPNNYDWGVLVADGKVISAEKSYPKKGEFRNNSCNGAKECFVDIKEVPENVKDIALKAGAILGLQWSRSDIIVDSLSGLPYLLEVNRFPGITAKSTEVIGATKFLRNCFRGLNS